MTAIVLNTDSDYFSFLPAETKEQIYVELDIQTWNRFATTCKQYFPSRISSKTIQEIFKVNCVDNKECARLVSQMPLEKFQLLKERITDLNGISENTLIQLKLADLNIDFLRMCLDNVEFAKFLFIVFDTKRRIRFAFNFVGLLNVLDSERFKTIIAYSKEFANCFLRGPCETENRKFEIVRKLDLNLLTVLLREANTGVNKFLTSDFAKNWFYIVDRYRYFDFSYFNGIRSDNFLEVIYHFESTVKLFGLDDKLDVSSINLFSSENLSVILTGGAWFKNTFMKDGDQCNFKSVALLPKKKLQIAFSTGAHLREWFITPDKVLDFLHTVSEDKLQILCEYTYLIERLFLSRYEYINGAGSFFDSQAFIDIPMDELLEKMGEVTKADRADN